MKLSASFDSLTDKIDLSFDESEDMISEEINTSDLVPYMSPEFLSDLASYEFNIF
jgi:hypothetical protein